jgi:hypothetical protein
MVSLTAVTATSTEKSPWRAMAFAALFTAVMALATALLFQAAMPILYILAFLLIGAAPVLGAQMAEGQLGRDWKALIGGIIGSIFAVVLWPILVGLLDRDQSVGRLLLASIVGFLLGVIGFWILGSIVGQDPAWVQWGWVVLWALWGGAVGAAMAAYASSSESA